MMNKDAYQQLNLPDQRHGMLWFHDARREPEMGIPHRHDELELNLVISGNAQIVFSDRIEKLNARTLIFLFPDQTHLLIHRDTDFQMWTVLLRSEALQSVYPQDEISTLKYPDESTKRSRQLSSKHTSALHRGFKCLQDYQSMPTHAMFNIELLRLFMLSWTHHQHSLITPQSSELHPAVQTVINQLHQERTALPMSELAKRVNLSPNHLGLIFKNETGMTVIEFRDQLRLKRFIDLYHRSPEMSLMTMALNVGFGSYAQFHRVFSKAYRISPRQWLNQQRLSG